MHANTVKTSLVEAAEKIEREAKILREASEILRKAFGVVENPVKPFGGTGAEQLSEYLGKHGGAATRTDIVRESGIQALPGVRTFLERLRDAGVPRVIGSSTPRENIDLVVKLVGLSEFFPEIVAAGDVTHGKPDPEVFLLGAKRLGFPAQRCVVFEDAHVGIEAARRAGMKVIGVATTHPAASIADADRVVHQLDELQASDVADLLTGN